jgi:hypothetical protein
MLGKIRVLLANGLRSFRREDDGMRVSWNEYFSHILDIVELLAAGRGGIAIVTQHFVNHCNSLIYKKIMKIKRLIPKNIRNIMIN